MFEDDELELRAQKEINAYNLKLAAAKEWLEMTINDYEESLKQIEGMLKEYRESYKVDEEYKKLFSIFQEKQHNLRVYKINFNTLF